MSARIRAFDWSATPLGVMTDWPVPLRTVVDLMLSSNQAMFATWGSERTLIYNDRYADILGRKHPGALGRPFHEVWSELDADVRPIMDRAYSGEPTHMDDLQLVMYRHDFAEETHFSFSYTPLRDEDGRVAGVFCPCVETTEKVLAERMLAEREAQLRSLMANSPAIISRFDREFRHVFVNAAAEAATGLAVDEFLGRTNRELGMPPELCDYWEAHISEAFETGQVQELDFAYEVDGGTRHYESKLVPELPADGGPAEYVLGVAHDVTDRKRAEEATRVREAQLRALFDAAPLGIYVIDADFRFLYVNPIAGVVLADVPAVIGRDFEEVVHRVWPPAMAEDIIGRFRRTLQTGEPYIVPEVAEKRQDLGVTEYYEWQIHRLKLPDERYGVVAYFRDISEQVLARKAIADSEERYRTLFSSMEEGFCVIELAFDDAGAPVDYRFLELNPAYARQMAVVDAVGRRATEVFQDLDTRALAHYGHVALTGEPATFTKRHASLGRWFDVSAFRVGLPQDRKVAVLFKDVTERKRDEQSLRRQNRQLQTLYHLSDAALRVTEIDQMCQVALDGLLDATDADRGSILLFDAEGVMRFRAWRGISDEYRAAVDGHTPWKPSDVDAQSITVEDVWLDDELAPYRETFDREGIRALGFIPLVEGGRVVGKFMVYYRQPHRFHDWELALYRAIAASVATCINRITAAEELRLERDRVRRSEQRFRTMADTAPAMIWVSDVTKGCTFVSRGWTDYTGQAQHDALGFGWVDSVHPDDRDQTRLRYVAASEAREAFSLDFRVRRLDGAYRWVLVEGRPRYDEAGEWSGCIGSVIDVHDRREVTEALRESEQHLRELSASLERRVAERTSELKQQTARLRRLAAELASAEQRERKRLAAMLHDEVQQLLVAALIKIGIARSQVDDDGTRDTLEEATRHLGEAVSAARDLTHQLRPPTLYEAGLMPALGWLGSEMRRRYDLHVEVDGEATTADIGDDLKALLFDCVRELLFNIVKHAGSDEARVEIGDANGGLRITVTDRGAGFDVNATATDYQSGGFGLFSIRERLAALGGSLAIDSVVGEGTRVELRVPPTATVHPPEAEDDLARMLWHAAEDAVRRSLAPDGDRIRVLVVDDHAIVREGLTTMIEADERLIVVGVAADGVEAIEAVRQHEPDVVLVDVNMPRMNGVEATRRIRRRWPCTAVIGLSVQGDDATASSMLAAGAQSFIPKAGDPADLIDAIVEVGVATRSAPDGVTAREATSAPS